MRCKTYLIAGILAVAITPLIILSFFNQPVGDDYWNTWIVKQYGIAGAQWHLFTAINGRFSASLFMSFNSFIHGSVLSFKLWPAAILIAWVIAMYRLLQYIFSKALTKCQRISLALLLVLEYYLNMPGLHEGGYWMSSVTCYQLPLLLYLFYIPMAGRYHQLPGWKKYLFYPVYIFVTGGFNEGIACMATVTGLCMIVIQWIQFKSAAQKQLIFTAASALAFGVQLLSGGNLYRAGITSVKDHPDLLRMLTITISQTAYHILIHCLLSPMFWLAAIVIFYFSNTYGEHIRKISLPFKNLLWILCTVFPFLILFPALLVVYIENNIAPLRVINVSYSVFTAGLYSITALYGASLTKRPIFSGFRNRITARQIALGFLMLIVSMAFSTNMRQVVSTLASGDAYRYNQEITKRFKDIKNCKQDSCAFTCLHHQPLILCPVDICQNPTLAGHLEKVYQKKLYRQ